MKKGIVSLVLALVLALGLCAVAAAAEAADGAISVSGLGDGQYAFVVGYDETGRFLGAKVLTSADAAAQPIPGAAEVKLFRTDGKFAPQGEAVSLPGAYQTVRKIDGQVLLCYEGPGGVSVTQTVTRKVTGSVGMWGGAGSLRIWSTNEPSGSHGQSYSVTALIVEGCGYTVSREGFQHWADQPGLPLNDTLDFYLDPWGNICWIEMAAPYEYPVDTYLILSAGVTGTSDGGATVQAELMLPSGTVLTKEVTILDGQPITDPSAAASQLSAHAPGGFYACQQQRDGTYSLSYMESGPDSTWGDVLTIPPDTVTAPAADFTGGAVNCLATDETIFVVSRGQPGEEKLTRYVGYRDLPAVTVLGGTVVTAEGDGAAPAARFVYLRTLDAEPPAPVELPGGCVFIVNNRMSAAPELYAEDVYRINIIDADGMRTDMRVSGGLALGISYDSIDAGQFADNFYVGKFCAVTGMDANGVVTALKPMETAEVSILGDGVIETDAGRWDYDDATRCVYVDLEDNGGQVTLADYNSFPPDSGLIDLGDVSTNPDSGAFYRSVKAAVIVPENSNVADYIYIVRELW